MSKNKLYPVAEAILRKWFNPEKNHDMRTAIHMLAKQLKGQQHDAYERGKANGRAYEKSRICRKLLGECRTRLHRDCTKEDILELLDSKITEIQEEVHGD